MLQKLIALLASASPSAGRIAGQNPVLVWVVVGVVGIVAVDVVAKEGISLWKEFAKAQYDVATAGAETEQARAAAYLECRSSGGCAGVEALRVNPFAKSQQAAQQAPASPPPASAPASVNEAESLAVVLLGVASVIGAAILVDAKKNKPGETRKASAKKMLRAAPLAALITYSVPWLSIPYAKEVGLQIEWGWWGLAGVSFLYYTVLTGAGLVFLEAVWKLLRKEEGLSSNAE